jgi:hypothetical protein
LALRGLPVLRTKLHRIAVQVEDVSAPIARDQAEAVLQRSQELVPVDTGDLKRSGRVLTGPPRKGRTIYQVAYGGIIGSARRKTIDYALYVHEDLTARHPRGGQAKYLERAALEKVKSIHDRFGRELGSTIKAAAR